MRLVFWPEPARGKGVRIIWRTPGFGKAQVEITILHCRIEVCFLQEPGVNGDADFCKIITDIVLNLSRQRIPCQKNEVKRLALACTRCERNRDQASKCGQD